MATKPKGSTALTVALTPEESAELMSAFPVEQSFRRAYLPRIAYKAQDVTEETKDAKGKKKIDIIIEAGTFLTDRAELDEEGNPVNDELGKQKRIVEEVGKDMEGIVVFERKQLRFNDQASGSFTSSPIYDSDKDIVPLFRDRAEIDRGTANELQHRPEYDGKTLKGKWKSLLEENRVLYILLNDELFELNLRGSSKFSYLGYRKKVQPPAVITHFSSETQENGDVSWNQMTFEAVRALTSKEAKVVREHQEEILAAIAAEKEFYGASNAGLPVGNAELEGEFKRR